jgi:glycosyltransferase involved in cell wall biosynthesis
MIMKSLKILLIGSFPPPYGGTTISLEYLYKALQTNNTVEIDTLNTSNYKSIFLVNKLVLTLLKKARSNDIITLHISSSSLYSFGLLVLFISKVFRKPMIVRKFGGTAFDELNKIKKVISCFIVRKSDLYLAQTKQLMNEAILGNRTQRVEWYPTNRPAYKTIIRNDETCIEEFKFIFIGAMKKNKGVLEIIKASSQLDPHRILIDMYGPIIYDVSVDIFNGFNNVKYKGQLEPSNVKDTLKLYNALLLPTYHPGEGYPGVVIEAFQVGLPVICTDWKALPELVDSTCGILIKPRCVDSLHKAMETLSNDRNYYKELRNGAFKRGEQFSTEFWADKFVNYCQMIANYK